MTTKPVSYVILCRVQGGPLRVMLDDKDRLMEWDSEEDADHAMEDHPLMNQPFQIVEVDI